MIRPYFLATAVAGFMAGYTVTPPEADEEEDDDELPRSSSLFMRLRDRLRDRERERERELALRGLRLRLRLLLRLRLRFDFLLSFLARLRISFSSLACSLAFALISFIFCGLSSTRLRSFCSCFRIHRRLELRVNLRRQELRRVARMWLGGEHASWRIEAPSLLAVERGQCASLVAPSPDKNQQENEAEEEQRELFCSRQRLCML